mmetsp:Transcript_26410/g.26660  ORF Transcript_26410/g.26660 Transcript_26410/m.26660 type:complete len:385 (+) Transcript_26410:47-1201(+)|eukprot:CAMPEP_0182429020 /NCGR_PEP_ID=MMETSP1167-20130531/25455_1 /TAXON_ID=2988 /ORGANISM="Mallomonas Sp, Strain CCMP3275" /LENGTH=384 /DNA_ID=CAMNT_0024612315 /DNA_START=45 /DNA_END=1199 /DNA_ORIENTATION=+
MEQQQQPYSILVGQPAFAQVPTYPQVEYGLPVDVLGVFAASQSMSIRQHVKLLPKHCCVCPPCVEQENTYSIYAGLTRDNAAEFLRVDEVSDDWNRCCCKPHHPWRLEVRQYIPPPGGDIASSDWQHLASDVQGDFSRFSTPEKAKFLKDSYQKAPVLFSIVRDDGMRCGWCIPRFPCKVLDCCIFHDVCADGVHVYSGGMADPEGEERGRPHDGKVTDRGQLIGTVKQPWCGGGCHPVMDLRNSDGDEPYGRVEGPYCFGGWMELCFDFKFSVSSFHGTPKSDDIAMIVKRKPSSLAMAATDLMSDADNYTIEFNPMASLTPAQKANIMSAQLLADYMYFDGNTDKCKASDDGVTCYFWYCSIYGCIVPCCIHIPNNKNGGGN